MAEAVQANNFVMAHSPEQPSDISGSLVVASPQTLADFSDKLARRVEWVRERIADECLEVNSSPNWPGRQELVEQTKAKFKLNATEASQLVDQTVAELSDEGPDNIKAQQRLSFLRLRSLRQLILKSIKDGRREITFRFKIVPHPDHPNDPTKRISIKEKDKEKIYEGIEMSQLAQLREVELAMENLLGLHDRKQQQQQNVLQLIFQQFEKRKNAQGEAEDNSSMASAAKQLSLEKLIEDPAAKAQLEAAVLELAGVPAAEQVKSKKIKSTVKKSKKTEPIQSVVDPPVQQEATGE